MNIKCYACNQITKVLGALPAFHDCSNNATFSDIAYIREVGDIQYLEHTLNFHFRQGTIYCVRGCPGSGKSTLVNALQQLSGGIICSADHYFINEDGEYIFDRDKIGAAHRACHNKCVEAIRDDHTFIYIDNTNTTAKEAKVYYQLALKHKYNFCIIEPFNDDARNIDALVSRNTHNVPRSTIEKMLRRFQELPFFIKKLKGFCEANEQATT